MKNLRRILLTSCVGLVIAVGAIAAGSRFDSIVVTGTSKLVGVITAPSGLTGNVTGNASTASAFDHNPSACSSHQFVTDQDASGTLSCSQPAFTDISGSVTNAMLSTVSTATFKGRTTSGTGAPEDLTATQATALLNNVVGDSGSGGTKGLVPAPASGDAAAGKFLKADGTWATASAAGYVTLTGSENLQNKTLADGSDATKKLAFSTSGSSSSTTTTLAFNSSANRTLTFPDVAGGQVLTHNYALTLTSGFGIQDSSDTTKAMAFLLSGATSSRTMTIASAHTTNRTLTLPDATDTLVGKATTDSFTNKTLTDSTNTLQTLGSSTFTIIGASSNPTKGTMATDQLGWAITGKVMHVFGTYYQTAGGSAGSGAYEITIPASKTVSSTYHATNSNIDVAGHCGTASGYSSAANKYWGWAYFYDTTHIGIALGSDAAQPGAWGSAYFQLSTTTLTINFECTFITT